MQAEAGFPRGTLEALRFDNRYHALGEDFYTPVRPTPLAGSYLIHANPDAAGLLGLEAEDLATPAFAGLVSGQALPDAARPLAMLYAGHQFGHYVPQLGDGRAILLGQLRNREGQSWDLQLKGAGLTAYSRDGDGKAVLRSSIREYLCSEAMHGLGIPTTRGLALVGSREEVYRENIETGAILARMAPSHVRFGSFEVFYYRGQYQQLKILADHVISDHYPELQDSGKPYLGLLREVIDRSARLAAQWQSVGFAHGVLNTDNMSVLGLTLDYGPFGFLDNYDAGFICNHSDHHGRYAFGRQPSIVLWNLSCFAQSILPILEAEEPEEAAQMARDELDGFESQYRESLLKLMGAKLGLQEVQADDQPLVTSLLETMQGNQVDFTRFFRSLAGFDSQSHGPSAIRDQFLERDAFDAWANQYRTRLQAEGSDDRQRGQAMLRHNPAIVLRNYMAQVAIEKAEQGDFSEIDQLLLALRDPYAAVLDQESYAGLPPHWAEAISVSCSS